MSAALVLRAVTPEQRAFVAQLAAAFDLAPVDWPNATALRECVEQLAVANTVERVRANPTNRRRSDRSTWLRAAVLLGLAPGTPIQRRVRAKQAALTPGACPTDPQSDAPTTE